MIKWLLVADHVRLIKGSVELVLFNISLLSLHEHTSLILIQGPPINTRPDANVTIASKW